MLKLGQGFGPVPFFMHIIKQYKVDRNAVEKAKLDYIKAGYGTEIATEHLRVDEAAAEASEARQMPKTVPGLGKLVAVMPQRDYFRILKKYGQDEVTSKEFLRYFQKHFPELTVSKV